METSRLIIRAPMLDDVDEMMAIQYSPFVLRYNAMVVQSREEFTKQLERGIEEKSILHMVEKESGRVIGSIFIQPDDLRYRVNSAGIAYHLGEEYARKGYMSEALKAVISYLFDQVGVDIISARAFSENQASVGLLEKLGFVREGCLRQCVRGYGDVVFDDVVFSMLKAERPR